MVKKCSNCIHFAGLFTCSAECLDCVNFSNHKRKIVKYDDVSKEMALLKKGNEIMEKSKKVSYVCAGCTNNYPFNPCCLECENGSLYASPTAAIVPTQSRKRDGKIAEYVYNDEIATVDAFKLLNPKSTELDRIIKKAINKELSSYVYMPTKITKVVFNDPATIVFWEDGTKTVVKADDEPFDKEKGLVMAITKKAFGNKGSYYNEIKKWIKED